MVFSSFRSRSGPNAHSTSKSNPYFALCQWSKNRDWFPASALTSQITPQNGNQQRKKTISGALWSVQKKVRCWNYLLSKHWENDGVFAMADSEQITSVLRDRSSDSRTSSGSGSSSTSEEERLRKLFESCDDDGDGLLNRCKFYKCLIISVLELQKV